MWQPVGTLGLVPHGLLDSHGPTMPAGGRDGARGDSVPLLSQQLRMFDMNGDGKLGLSEMSR